MIKVLPIFLFIILGLSSCEKNQVDNLIIDQPNSKEEIITHEKKMGSTFFETKYNGTPPKQGLNDSIVYEESLMFVNYKTEPLPLKSKYFYDSKGEFKVIFHEWNLATPGLSIAKNDSLMATQDGKIDWYYDQFIRTANQMTERIGNPSKGNIGIEREKIEIMDFYKSYVQWDMPDKTVILKLYWVPKPGYKIYKYFVTVYFK